MSLDLAQLDCGELSSQKHRQSMRNVLLALEHSLQQVDHFYLEEK